MSRLVSLAALLLSEPQRGIYREQWLADLRDASELGVSRSSIIAGALLFGVTHRTSVAELRLPPSLRVHLRVRRALALLFSGGVAVFGIAVAGLSFDTDGSTAIDAVTLVVFALHVAIAVAGIGGGLIALAPVARLDGVALGAALTIGGGLAAAVASVLWRDLSFALVPVAILLVAGGMLALGICCLLTAPAVTSESRLSRPERGHGARASRIAAGAGALAIAATVVVGAVDGLVWMPSALGPGLSLETIYAAIAPDRTIAVAMIVGWAVIGCALAAALLPLGRMLPARYVVTIALGVVSAAVFFNWFASFGMANAVSDAVPPYSGGNSAVAPIYWFIGQLALIAVLLRSVAPRSAQFRGTLDGWTSTPTM